MKSVLALVVAVSTLTGVARAQSTSHTSGYVEGVAQSAFGNVTSQSFGVEAGATLHPGIQAFIDFGQVRDAAPSGIGAGAQSIAGFLAQTQAGVAFQVKEPTTFGVAGVRYLIPLTGRLEPYVLAGGGLARVSKDVSFTVAGSDVTASLTQYGVVLGTDLSGRETDAMLTVGGGVAWPAGSRLVVDFQYRYGRIFAGTPINVNRAGVGIGVRF